MKKKDSELSCMTDSALWALYKEKNPNAKYFEEIRDLVTEIIERFGRLAENN